VEVGKSWGKRKKTAFEYGSSDAERIEGDTIGG